MAFVSSSILTLFVILFFKSTLCQNQQTCNVTLTLKEQDTHGFVLKNYFNDKAQIDSCWFIVKSFNPDYGIQVQYEKILDVKSSNCSSKCCEFLDIGDGTKVGEDLKISRCLTSSFGFGETDIINSDAIWLNFRDVKNLLTMLKFLPIKLTYKQPSGFISSPTRKNGYLNNLNVTYNIQTKEDHLVYMRFSSFSLESYNNTCMDYLEIGAVLTSYLDKTTAIKENTVNKYCGSVVPVQAFIYSNDIYLRLVTDQSEVSTGFNLYYNTIKYLFTEPFGKIISSDYPINITYMIRAPADQKIELVVNEFSFSECNVDEADDLVDSPNLVCSKSNDFLMFSNQMGSIDAPFYESMNQLNDPSSKANSEWIFCACNRPVRTYISLTNELNIKYFLTSSQKMHRYGVNSFNLVYRFVPGEFSSNNNLRIIQDQVTSFIGGYYLNVRIPADNHLRLFGKSSKCIFPKYSLIEKAKMNEKRLQPITVNDEEFKKDCSYLFDLSEPVILQANSSSNSDWKAIWFIKFDNSSSIQDFEINWKFLKNKFIDEKKPSTLTFPAQIGFGLSSKENRDSLDFYFQSTNQNRKYALNFNCDSSTPISNSKQTDYVKVDLMNGKSEFYVPNGYLNLKESTTSFALESRTSILKMKRTNKFSLEVTYKLDSQLGDCDFDFSFCNYTVDPELVELNQEDLLITHKPKYNSLNTNEYDVLTKAKDYFLSVLKSNDNKNGGYLYSPMIKLHKKNGLKFNQKIFKLSFSYMVHNHSDNRISLVLMTNRSDVKVPVVRNDILAEYSGKSLDFDKSVSPVTLRDDCPIYTKGSMLNTFVLTHTEKKSKTNIIPSQFSPVTLTSRNDMTEGSTRTWFRVNKSIYSCFDFRFGFRFNFSETAHSTESVNLNSASPIGLDDVELNEESSVSECDKEICGQNGKCFKFEESSVCCCNPGYEGEQCERQVSPCAQLTAHNDNTNICQNSGKCRDVLSEFDYVCDCPAGYGGQNCEFEINECGPRNPCNFDGQCIDLVGDFECICKTGFTGKTCDIRAEYCKDKCSVAGTARCLNDKRDALCVCLPDYTGSDCSTKISIDYCLSNPCSEEASCESNSREFKCICPDDRIGTYCEHKFDYCSIHGYKCKNGSVCTFASMDGKNVKCSCEAGFTGSLCDTLIKECDSNPCKTGTCVNLHLGYQCICPKGFIGKNCGDKPKNPCHKNACVKGVCVPDYEVGNYTCECNHEATGDFCEKEICNKERHASEVCDKEGTEKVITYEQACKCVCKVGFSGKNCDERQNLCELRAKIAGLGEEEECKNGGKCAFSQTTNQITCLCPEGFFGDRCQIAENNCKKQPCKYGSCKNEGNSYKCMCTRGWKGKNCDERLDICSMDACVKNNTLNVEFSKQSCICMCKLGFTGDRCQTNINDCENHLCENNSTCVDLIASFDCICPHGFSGPYCDKMVTSCALNPCNNGTCEEIAGKTKCNCDRGFTGEFCDVVINKCEPNPCENSAKCHNLIDDYYCACLPEFGDSKNCSERLIDPCLSYPCYNDATCNAVTVSSGTHKNKVIYKDYTCRCKPGFKGKFCDITMDPCSSGPCQNRGNCVLSKGTEDYNCQCYPLFTGKNCESFFDPCTNGHMCKNGGECLATPGGYKCKCPTNYDGENCEILTKPCDMLSCLNGGECTVVNEIPKCICPSIRYIGTRCEIDMTNIKYKTKGSPLIKSAAMESDEMSSCDILGNNTGPINYLFAFVLIFSVLLVIGIVMYMYVRFSIKRFKRNGSLKRELNDNPEEYNNHRRFS
jgi:hypothetical protein